MTLLNRLKDVDLRINDYSKSNQGFKGSEIKKLCKYEISLELFNWSDKNG